MRFRKNARLDPSQVEDYRGASGGSGRPGGVPITLGGGGLIGVARPRRVSPPQRGWRRRRRPGSPCRTDRRPGNGLDRSPDRVPHGRRRERAGRLPHRRGGQQRSGLLVEDGTELRASEDAVLHGQHPDRLWRSDLRVGPFYCPRDRYIYIDLGFFDDLRSQLGARGGPLAEAYVLAHEYGHHVQNLTGALRSANRDTGPQGGQVRLELQADCYAGLWVGTRARHRLRRGHHPAGCGRRARRRSSGGRRPHPGASRRPGAHPESWTHGSAEQRKSWFVRGVEGSGPRSCDTFRGRV